MAAGVAGETIKRQERRVYPKHQCPDPDAESVREPKSEDCIPPQKYQHDCRQPKELAVKVLEDEREARFTRVTFSRVSNGAGGWRP
jgi:hypothetical protein